MAKNPKQEILLLNKGFMVDVVKTLTTLDVRGYESNQKLVHIVEELQRAIVTDLPLEINSNQQEGKVPAEARDKS